MPVVANSFPTQGQIASWIQFDNRGMPTVIAEIIEQDMRVKINESGNSGILVSPYHLIENGYQYD